MLPPAGRERADARRRSAPRVDVQLRHAGGTRPTGSPLRPIRRMTDAALAQLSDGSTGCTQRRGGRRFPPEKLLRALLLQLLYSIRSERLLMEELDYSVLYRWFVGLSLDDPIWDATTFTKNRDRLLAGDMADAFFAEGARRDQGGGPALGRALYRRRDAARGMGESQEFQTEERPAHPARRPEESDGEFSRPDAPQRHPSVDHRPGRAALQEGVRHEAKLAISATCSPNIATASSSTPP